MKSSLAPKTTVCRYLLRELSPNSFFYNFHYSERWSNCRFLLQEIQSARVFRSRIRKAYWSGSWAPVERLQIRNGVGTFINNEGETMEETIPMSDLRIRSRKATLADCLCFLRPGTYICIHSTLPTTEEESSNENPKLVWIDARISSVEWKPHEEDKCVCEFHVSIHLKQTPAGMINKAVDHSSHDR